MIELKEKLLDVYPLYNWAEEDAVIDGEAFVVRKEMLLLAVILFSTPSLLPEVKLIEVDMEARDAEELWERDIAIALLALLVQDGRE